MDDLRLLLMREPRGHGAMSGAILQPPLRDDADWGVVFIEVTGCLPMCGHGTIGVATVLVETGMVEVTRARDGRAARHARRARRGARGGRGRARPLGQPAQRALVPARARAQRRGERRQRHLRHGLRRQLLRAAAGRGRRARGRPGARARADRARPRDHGRDQRVRAPGAPGRRAHRRLPARRLHRSRARTGRARSGAPPRSTRAGSTARRAAPAPRPSWRSCTRAGSWPWARSSSTAR